jgi:hypothetical protein
MTAVAACGVMDSETVVENASPEVIHVVEVSSTTVPSSTSLASSRVLNLSTLSGDQRSVLQSIPANGNESSATPQVDL